jgi:hypothetical protein
MVGLPPGSGLLFTSLWPFEEPTTPADGSQAFASLETQGFRSQQRKPSNVYVRFQSLRSSKSNPFTMKTFPCASAFRISPRALFTSWQADQRLKIPAARSGT